ncbi:MAG: calcium-binding protein [Nitrosomonas sp.]|nr:hypothetical protein [Nitrosomonas sp.]
MINVAIDYKGAVNQLSIQDELTEIIYEAFSWLDQHIVFKGTIDVNVNIEETSTGRFGGTGTVHEFLGTQDGLKTWEHTAITESRTGIDVNPYSPEFIINIDPYSNYLQNLWWDPTPSTLSPDEIPSNKTDAFSVVLHEILHGMGISGWLDWETGEHTTNRQSIWDSHIIVENGQAYFSGDHVNQLLGEPVEVRLGGSQGAYHLGSASSNQPLLKSSIMNSYYFRLGERYLPTDLEFAILEDLGWTLKTHTSQDINNNIEESEDNIVYNSIEGTYLQVTSINNNLMNHDYDDLLNNNGHANILDGSQGNDVLIGGPENDIIKTGYGYDDITGGEGKDIFSFYAPGHFVIHDFDPSADLFIFDSEKTGLYTIQDLLSIVAHIEDNETGVIVHFVKELSSITLIGLHSEDLSIDMVGFV